MWTEMPDLKAEDAVAQGYRRISNKHRLVARIDRADWLEVLATEMRRAPADFIIRSGAKKGEVDPGWNDHYRRCLSKDVVKMSPAEALKVPTSGFDEVGYIGPPSPRLLICPRCHTEFKDEDPTKEYPHGIICPACPRGGLVGVIHPGLDLR
jgi:hypothetical protein